MQAVSTSKAVYKPIVIEIEDLYVQFVNKCFAGCLQLVLLPPASVANTKFFELVFPRETLGKYRKKKHYSLGEMVNTADSKFASFGITGSSPVVSINRDFYRDQQGKVEG